MGQQDLRRRDFLKLPLIASGAALLLQCKGEIVGSPEKGKIIVVGAGMAGLSAARTLHDKGHEVMVLEARARLGGRVHTSREWPDAPMDLGASWIHGIRGNPITALAKEAEVDTMVTDYDNAILYDLEGNLSPDRVWKKLAEYEADINKALAKASRLDDDLSIEDAIAEVIDLETLSEGERQQLNLVLNYRLEQDWAADVAELSAKYVNDDEPFGGNDVIFPNGYDELIDHIARELDIRKEHVVEKIAYDEKGVSVVTNQGTFEADRAIITLPLGILQSGKVLFDPPLPKFWNDERFLASVQHF